MKYFAYGMNTNLTQMGWRCPKAQNLGGATLKNHLFRFSSHADIIESTGFTVQGALWEITDDCVKSLDALEGYPSYYERKTVKVTQNETGEVFDAMTYYMVGNLPDDPPSKTYLDMLYEGYAQNDISARQIIEALEFVSAYQTALAQRGQYVYG